MNFLTLLEAGSPRPRSGGVGPSRSLSPWLAGGPFPSSPHVAFSLFMRISCVPLSFYEEASPVGSGVHPSTSFNLSDLLPGPISKYSHMWVRAAAYEF